MTEMALSFNSEARLKHAADQCRRYGHPQPPPGLAWDSTVSWDCVNCGDPCTREPVARTAEEDAELEVQADIIRQRSWGPGSRLVVTVTPQDIREGSRGNPLACPIARAAGRELRPETQFCLMSSDSVGTLHVFTSRDDGQPPRVDVFVDPEAGEWAARFDKRRGDVAPERFIFRRRES